MKLLRWVLPLVLLAVVGYVTRNWWRSLDRYEPRLPMGIEACSIRVQVLNGTSTAGAGRDVAEWLSRQGFDVYGYRDGSQIVPRTMVIDRRDPDQRHARAVRNFLTVPARKFAWLTLAPRVQPECGSDIDSLLFLEVTLHLGEDYRKFFPVAPRPFP